jgi:3-oxoacyl-[acyl-carrier-protein] synthase II
MRRNADRRVVVTGVGLVTPLGTGVDKNWEAMMAGRSGVGPITRFDVSDFATRIAGEVRDFDPLDWIDKKDVRKMDLFIQYAVASAEQAMRQSGLKIDESNADRVGVLIGNGIGGLCTIEENHLIFLETRLKRITPFFIPKLISNLAPGQPDDSPRLYGRSDYRRRRSGADLAGDRRVYRDARVIDAQ